MAAQPQQMTASVRGSEFEGYHLGSQLRMLEARVAEQGQQLTFFQERFNRELESIKVEVQQARATVQLEVSNMKEYLTAEFTKLSKQQTEKVDSYQALQTSTIERCDDMEAKISGFVVQLGEQLKLHTEETENSIQQLGAAWAMEAAALPPQIPVPASRPIAGNAAPQGRRQERVMCPSGCGRSFPDQDSLQVHVATAHAAYAVPAERQGVGLHDCFMPACGRSFPTPEDLQEHMLTEHPGLFEGSQEGLDEASGRIPPARHAAPAAARPGPTPNSRAGREDGSLVVHVRYTTNGHNQQETIRVRGDATVAQLRRAVEDATRQVPGILAGPGKALFPGRNLETRLDAFFGSLVMQSGEIVLNMTAPPAQC